MDDFLRNSALRAEPADRDLLMLAAKAIGLLDPSDDDDIWHDAVHGIDVQWNPLDDDGDALRLAVAAHIDIRHFMYERNYMDCLVDRIGRRFREDFTSDPFAATRRAIVRAAAEIGTNSPAMNVPRVRGKHESKP